MNVGDTFGALTVVNIVYRQRRDGTRGAPLLVDVKCQCGVEKTLRADVLMGKRPQQSCGSKGCKKKGPPQPRPARPPKARTEIWYCRRRAAAK